MLSSLLPGAAERVSLDIARHLHRKGNDVHLLVARISRECPAIYQAPEGVTVHHLSHGADNTIWRSLGNKILLEKIIREISPEWVISLGAQYRLLYSCGIQNTCKILLSERNYPPKFYSNKDIKFVKKCYEIADKVVFQTREAAECFPELRASQVEVIPNAARPSATLWTGSNSKRIAFVGRLSPQKNPMMMIKAFALFLSDHDGYCLDLYGDGEMRAELEAWVKSLHLTESIVFHGHSKRVQKDISSSAMYVSTSDYEGISNSMLEAMSMGMPCVCTDCAGGGARLAIRDGENGLLVPPGDIEAMAAAIAQVADNPPLARRLGATGKESMKRFSPEVIYGRWADVLES